MITLREVTSHRQHGARALIEEIIAEASGEMKAKAQKALNQLT